MRAHIWRTAALGSHKPLTRIFNSGFKVHDIIPKSRERHQGRASLLCRYIWESKADGNFAISEDTEGASLGRGTLINIYLKVRILGAHSAYISDLICPLTHPFI